VGKKKITDSRKTPEKIQESKPIEITPEPVKNPQSNARIFSGGTGIPSVKKSTKLESTVEDSGTKNYENLPPPDPSVLDSYWENLVEFIEKEKNYASCAAILKQRHFEVVGHILKLSVFGEVELANVVEIKTEIVDFLRKKEDFKGLSDLEIILLKPEENADLTKPYTPEEKLRAMEAKNPLLIELQKRFNTSIVH
jgi:hypothetical protein